MLPLIPLLALILLLFGSGKHLHTHAIPLHSDPYCVYMYIYRSDVRPQLLAEFCVKRYLCLPVSSRWHCMFEAYTQVCVCWLEGMKTQQNCTLVSLMIDQIVSLRASVFIINPAAQHMLAPAISILMGTRLWRATIPDV